MAVLLDQFVETLSQSGLMTAGDMQEFLDGLQADERPETGEDLAKLLVRHDKLTRFQAQCIYQGKTKGLVFDEYTVLDKIGQGGMGIVLKAQHRRMKRLVAVKMLPAAALKNKEAVKRFYREVEAAARLAHPNVVTAHDAREHAGIHYLVMEYVQGKDLAELVAERGPLPVGQAVNCVMQAAKGLEYAHKQGIIHRDIKPSNLLLDREATVKILDMGLARIFEGGDATDPDRLTGSGQVMGTCDYMAPEQAEDTHGADHRADIYSLGCTLYRLLTGERPYSGDSMIQVLMAHRAAEIPSARGVRSDIPESVDNVCRKMMAKAPEDRYQSMTEVLAALEACVAVKTPVPSPVADESSSDGALTSFLQSLPKESVATSQKAARVAENTLKSHVGQDTSSNIWAKLVPADRRQMWTYAGIAGGVVLGIAFMLKTPEGTSVVTVKPDAEISVDDGKIAQKSPDDDEPAEVGVVEGKHTLNATEGGFRKPTGHEKTGLVRKFEGHTENIRDVAFLPDGKHVLSGSGDATVRLWDVSTGKEVRQFGERGVYGMAVAPCGTLAVTGSLSSRISLWDVRSGKEILFGYSPSYAVRALVFAPDARTFLTGGGDGEIVSWNTETGSHLKEFAGHKAAIFALAFLPDGRSFLAGDGRGNLVQWDIQSGKEIRRIKHDESAILELRLMPDGKRVISVGDFAKVRLWDIATGRLLGKLEGHRFSVASVAVLPGGKYVVTGGDDQTIRVWDIETAKELHKFEADTFCTRHLDVSPDGRYVISGAGYRVVRGTESDGDYALRLWRLPAITQ